ncbi:MAG: ABC transporter ATP-binding protein [Lachnospiraceae bacterium]|nr:ABC transporter ATP-binding protein [Lachnospiraceae bacterium]
MATILSVKDLSKNQILHNVDFDLHQGEMVAIMGPSGAGKSTLLYNISGMDEPDQGEVLLDNRRLTGLSEEEKARLRLYEIGFVFQQMNTIANLDIWGNILLPALGSKDGRKNKRVYEERAKKLMKALGIEELSHRKVTEVSGGQLQRACICRSMIMSPKLLFADEPTGALNRSASDEVMESFLKLNREGTTILMVTHDSLVASRCDRVLYLLDGAIRGELSLGKFEAEEGKRRAERTRKWLEGLGW